jgi:hypothetical protein
MRNVRLFAAVILLISVLLGCGGGNKMVGTWEGSFNGAAGTMTYNADNTFKIEMAAAGKKVTMSGDYKLESDTKLTMTLKDAKVEGASPQEEAAFKQAFAGDMNKPDSATLTWKSDKEVEFKSDKGQVTTLTKKS